MIAIESLKRALNSFIGNTPFDHCVIDDFFDPEVAAQLSQEFLSYDSPRWFTYKNPIEDKKALNDWNAYPPLTYQVLALLQSPAVVGVIEEALGKKIYIDHGLHGGGWHIHGPGGNLNPHLDYSIHPKLRLQRMLNLIIYLSPEMRAEYGGHLGLWAHDEKTNHLGQLVSEIEPKFNRAILFNTMQNSWHGLSRPLTQPEGIYRKSLAIYYLCDPEKDANQRNRALFAPRESQKDDPRVAEIVRLRSDVTTSERVYRMDDAQQPKTDKRE